MAVRRPSLMTTGKKAGAPEEVAAKAVVETAAVVQDKPARWPRATTRQGKRGIVVWVDQQSFIQVGIIAREEDRTIQSLMIEALNALYASRGKPRYE